MLRRPCSGPVACRLPSSSRLTQGSPSRNRTQDELHLHGHGPAQTHDDAHDVAYGIAHRHEVDQPDGAFRRFEIGLEYQRARAVAPQYLRVRRLRCDLPAPVLGRAEQRGEACVGIEARPAQPAIDPSVPRGSGGTVAMMLIFYGRGNVVCPGFIRLKPKSNSRARPSRLRGPKTNGA